MIWLIYSRVSNGLLARTTCLADYQIGLADRIIVWPVYLTEAANRANRTASPVAGQGTRKVQHHQSNCSVFYDSVFWKCSELDLLRYVTLSFFHSGFMREDSDERCLLVVNFSISDSFKFTTQSVYSPTVLLVWQVTDRRANRSGHACWMGGNP